MDILVLAALLGIVEGLTEFLPISSTGHLVLLVDVLGFPAPPGKTFEVAIQIGAIMAVCVAYRARLWRAVRGFTQDATEQAFVRNLVIAFLPAMLVGAMAYPLIRQALDSPTVIACMLVAGGIAMLAIERRSLVPTLATIESMKAGTALRIGAFQCIAMIPGVSRSGATIMGALLVGVERRIAAEFSFFLAIPTMMGATTYSLYKNWNLLEMASLELLMIATIAAFVTALLVIRAALALIGRHGFSPFAWYRIVLGVAILGFLQSGF